MPQSSPSIMFYVVPAIVLLSIIVSLIRTILRWSAERKRAKLQEKYLEAQLHARAGQPAHPAPAHEDALDGGAGTGENHPPSLEDSYLDARRRNTHRR
ncbi:MAG: hypothetical protein ACTHXO_13210 [Actinomycetaceae bacterium]